MAYTVAVKVTWDRAKNVANQKKHGVSFEEAFIAIGPIRRGLVMVVWTECDGDVVRIISARWATRNEQALFRSYIRRLT